MDFRSSTGVIRGLQVGAHLAQTIARRQANELRPTKKARFTGLLCGTKRGIGTGLAPAYTKNIWNFSSLGSGASFPSAPSDQICYGLHHRSQNPAKKFRLSASSGKRWKPWLLSRSA